MQELKDAEKLILEDAGVIPLLQIGNAKLRNQKISEMKVHSIGAKYDYKTMEINKKPLLREVFFICQILSSQHLQKYQQLYLKKRELQNFLF